MPTSDGVPPYGGLPLVGGCGGGGEVLLGEAGGGVGAEGELLLQLLLPVLRLESNGYHTRTDLKWEQRANSKKASEQKINKKKLKMKKNLKWEQRAIAKKQVFFSG